MSQALATVNDRDKRFGSFTLQLPRSCVFAVIQRRADSVELEEVMCALKLARSLRDRVNESCKWPESGIKLPFPCAIAAVILVDWESSGMQWLKARVLIDYSSACGFGDTGFHAGKSARVSIYVPLN